MYHKAWKRHSLAKMVAREKKMFLTRAQCVCATNACVQFCNLVALHVAQQCSNNVAGLTCCCFYRAPQTSRGFNVFRQNSPNADPGYGAGQELPRRQTLTPLGSVCSDAAQAGVSASPVSAVALAEEES